MASYLKRYFNNSVFQDKYNVILERNNGKSGEMIKWLLI